MKVAGWIAANLFFLACAALAAGYTWGAIALLRRFGDGDGYLWLPAAIGIVFASYYSAKWLHALLARRPR